MSPAPLVASLEGGRGEVEKSKRNKIKGRETCCVWHGPVKPVEILIKPRELDLQFHKVLDNLTKFVVELPKDVLIPILGDFGAEVPDTESEPVYGAKARANIQGNTIPGFNKDHQHFLFFRLGNLRRAKQWLHWITPLITSMEEVLAFVRAHRALRLRLGVKEPPMCATWVNIGFSYNAIAQLVGKADAEAFGDQSFRQGLAERSTYLGDPTRRSNPGHRSRWLVGGPKNEADC